jgi:DNA-binding NtrC family response regulator
MLTMTPEVLVIDGLTDTATVLQAVLSARGAVVRRSRGPRWNSIRGDREQPDVIVVDADNVDRAEWSTPSDRPPRRQVIIGSQRVRIDHQQSRFLQKPFQFPELIAAVEDLLDCGGVEG